MEDFKQRISMMDDNEEEEQLAFEDMALDPRLLKAIAKRGLSNPTPIQLKAIPLILEGKDVVARAKTGSGKTLAYLLPLLHKCLRVGEASSFGPTAVVLVPTRELCQQVYSEVLSLLGYCGGAWKAAQLTSSMSPSTLRTALAGHPDIVVSTPACLAMCICEKILNGSTLQASLSTLVLDEADLLLSYGYEYDLRSLAPHIPRRCQCLLMSATSSADIEKLKKLVLHNPVILTLMDEEGSASDSIVPKTIQQFLISCAAEDKLLHMLALLHFELVQRKAIIFMNSIDMSFRLKLFLEQFGVKSAVLNAELPQNSRLHILQEFNISLFDYLIVTDDCKPTKTNDCASKILAKSKQGGGRTDGSIQKARKQAFTDAEFGVVRGIDFKNVRTVINFDMPETPSGYIHRIGRTGRAQSMGASISLVSPGEEELLHAVEQMLNGGHDNAGGKHITPFPLLSKTAVEYLRYRAEDVGRGVTKVAVREARAKELRMEILNSERLKAHFEDNPKDLELLKHDKVLSKKQPLPHLKTVPEYLCDPRTEAASKSVKLARAAMGKSQNLLHARLRRKRARADDPLKTFSANPKRGRKGFTVKGKLFSRQKGKKEPLNRKSRLHQKKHRHNK